MLLAVEDRRTVIIDADGGTYEDLDDFRSRNDMFTADDWILVAKDFTAVNGGGTTTVPARISKRRDGVPVAPADEVRVVSEGGYVGAATRREIEYAREKRKVISSVEPTLTL